MGFENKLDKAGPAWPTAPVKELQKFTKPGMV
jgi:hypothetical protein